MSELLRHYVSALIIKQLIKFGAVHTIKPVKDREKNDLSGEGREIGQIFFAVTPTSIV